MRKDHLGGAKEVAVILLLQLQGFGLRAEKKA
jgi:hypothetical protein